jgi:hypothetical protein
MFKETIVKAFAAKFKMQTKEDRIKALRELVSIQLEVQCAINRELGKNLIELFKLEADTKRAGA